MTPNRQEEFKRRLKKLQSEGINIVFSTDIVKPEEPTDVPIDAIKYLGKNEPLPTIQDRDFGYASGQDKRRERRAKERAPKKK